MMTWAFAMMNHSFQNDDVGIHNDEFAPMLQALHSVLTTPGDTTRVVFLHLLRGTIVYNAFFYSGEQLYIMHFPLFPRNRCLNECTGVFPGVDTAIARSVTYTLMIISINVGIY